MTTYLYLPFLQCKKKKLSDLPSLFPPQQYKNYSLQHLRSNELLQRFNLGALIRVWYFARFKGMHFLYKNSVVKNISYILFYLRLKLFY